MRDLLRWTWVLLLLGCKSTGVPEGIRTSVGASPPVATALTPAATAAAASAAALLSPVAALPQAGECKLLSAAVQTGKPFGGSYFGFPVWLSRNGRFVVLYQFRAGESADGKTPPKFGHHGESSPPPQPVLFDLDKAAEEPFDDWLIAEPAARYAVLRKGQTLWLLDGLSGARLDLATVGASTQPDDNRCLPPREVAFDPTGQWLSFLEAPGEGVVLLRNLAVGDQIRLTPGPGRLWRVEARSLPGWALLREVAKDTNGDGKIELPRQRTSCVCRHCQRFALSYGYYGWSGDEFHSFLVSASGARIPADAGELFPLSPHAVYNPKTKSVLSDQGQPLPLPPGCTESDFAVGAAGLLLRCSSGSQLYFPETQRARPLSQKPVRLVGASLVTGANGERWALVVVTEKAGGMTLARLNMGADRGEMQPLAEVSAIAESDHHGWVTAAAADGFLAVHIGTGARLHARVPGASSPSGLTVKLPRNQWAAIDPIRCRYFTTAEEPGYQDARGCLLRPTTTSQEHQALEKGPWRLDCAQ